MSLRRYAWRRRCESHRGARLGATSELGWDRPRAVSRPVMLPSIVEEHRSDQRCPAGLMAGADAGAVISVEVFMKRNVIPPMRIGLKVVVVAPNGASTAAGRVAQEDVRQPTRQVRGNFAQVAPPSGAGRAFHLQGVSVVEVVIVQC